MSEIIEKRDVKVKICDFCNKEVSSLSKCVICKRDMCNADFGRKHAAHLLEVYSFKLENKVCSAHICKECADRKTDLTIGQLLDCILGEAPVSTIDVVVHSGIPWLLESVMRLGFVDPKEVARVSAEARLGQSVVSVLLEKKLITP